MAFFQVWPNLLHASLTQRWGEEKRGEVKQGEIGQGKEKKKIIIIIKWKHKENHGETFYNDLLVLINISSNNQTLKILKNVNELYYDFVINVTWLRSSHFLLDF